MRWGKISPHEGEGPELGVKIVYYSVWYYCQGRLGKRG